MKLLAIFAFISFCIMAADATFFPLSILQKILKASSMRLETRITLESSAGLLGSQVLNGAVFHLPRSSFIQQLANRLFHSEHPNSEFVDFISKNSIVSPKFLACAVLLIRSGKPSLAKFYEIFVDKTRPSSDEPLPYVPFSVVRASLGLSPEISVEELKSGEFLTFMQTHYPLNPVISGDNLELIYLLIKALEEASLSRDETEITLFLEHLIVAYFLRYFQEVSDFVAIIDSVPYSPTRFGRLNNVTIPINLDHISFYIPSSRNVDNRSTTKFKIGTSVK